MSKSGKKNKNVLPAPATRWSFSEVLFGFLSRRGKKFIGLGILVVFSGFWVLTATDPAGRNWASHLSPLLLIAGYALIGIGIVLKDPLPPTQKPS